MLHTHSQAEGTDGLDIFCVCCVHVSVVCVYVPCGGWMGQLYCCQPYSFETGSLTVAVWMWAILHQHVCLNTRSSTMVLFEKTVNPLRVSSLLVRVGHQGQTLRLCSLVLFLVCSFLPGLAPMWLGSVWLLPSCLFDLVPWLSMAWWNGQQKLWARTNITSILVRYLVRAMRKATKTTEPEAKLVARQPWQFCVSASHSIRDTGTHGQHQLLKWGLGIWTPVFMLL